jgi:plasmid stabilization system protein ParE
MNVIFLEEAEQELLEAVLYYDKQAQGLGKKFADEVYQATTNISDFPLINQKLTDDIRLKRYPFSVLYRIDGQDIIVIALMHLKRKPFYWQNRL